MVERYTAQIGDTGVTGNPGTLLNKAESVLGFQRYGEPIFAQIAYMLNGNVVTGIHGDIFTENPERVADDIALVIQKYGKFELDSVNLTGYGFTALRDGVPSELEAGDSTLRDLWLYYGHNGGHGHCDTLNIGIHAFGIDLMPDLGYPEQANPADMHRLEWVKHVVSHNTVQVDRHNPSTQWVATPKHYDNSEIVKLIDVEAPLLYPQTDLYKRTSALIRVDDNNSYAIDFFHVRGGSEHHFSFHGAEGTVLTEGLDLVGQKTGTYAGTDTQFGIRPEHETVVGGNYSGPGFHWLRNVERDGSPSAGFSVDWCVKDTWNVLDNGTSATTDIHLRLTMLTKVDEVALADGVPPRNKPGNPATLRYMLAHRDGRGETLDSLFTSVIEPYKGERFISSIQSVEIVTGNGDYVDEQEAKAVKVTLSNGRVDYLMRASHSDRIFLVDGRIEFSGFFGLYSENNGETVHRYVHDGTRIGLIGESNLLGIGHIEGEIVDFTREMSSTNYIDVSMNLTSFAMDQLKGTFIYVENDGEWNASYKILGVTQLELRKFRLDIGDISLIRRYRSQEDPEQGFIYDLVPGAAFRIPLSHSD
jgi:hypothetical protein